MGHLEMMCKTIDIVKCQSKKVRRKKISTLYRANPEGIVTKTESSSEAANAFDFVLRTEALCNCIGSCVAAM